jgi:hypothetical protein
MEAEVKGALYNPRAKFGFVPIHRILHPLSIKVSSFETPGRLPVGYHTFTAHPHGTGAVCAVA